MNPFYRVADGRQSCYGDQLRCVVRSLARRGGVVDAGDVAAALRDRMTGRDYEATAAVRRTREAYADDQRATAPPVDGPWRHGTIERFLERPNAVTDDDASADALLRTLPVAAVLATGRGVEADEREETRADQAMLGAVDAVVAVTQRNDDAREHAAAVAVAIARLVSGVAATPRAALKIAAKCPPVSGEARETLRDCLAAVDEPTFDAAVDTVREQLCYDALPRKKLIA